MSRLLESKSTEDVPWQLLDLTDDGIYEGKCPEGHSIRFSLQNQRHELLYESGIVALLIGFHREAVSSIATALERFFEFCVRVMATINKVEPHAFDQAWKDVGSQSERQLGAFLFLYLTTFKKPFTTPEGRRSFQKMIEFRNGVIHKGRIPTREHAMEFANDVYAIAQRVLAELRGVNADAVGEADRHLIFEVQREAHQKFQPMKGADGRYRGPSVVSWSLMLHGSESFDKALAEAEQKLGFWGFGSLKTS